MYNQNPFIFLFIRVFSKLDWVLMGALMVLMGLGAMTLYSASTENAGMIERQMIHFIAAFLVMLLFAQLPSGFLQHTAIWVYGAGLLVLVLVLVIGTTGKGAQRWLDLGVIRFQPSEIMKLAVPLMVARYFSDRVLPPRFIDIFIASFLVVIPVLLIAKQPDLGTSLLVASAGFFVIFFAGISWKWIFSIIVSAMIAAPLLFFYGMHDYQRQRVLTLFDPASDRLGSGYHILQSMIAIGSGGRDGKGWLDGDQSRLNFLPERHTDFIFAVFGEEFGFTGNLLLLALYLFIIYRAMYLASKAKDTFSRLLGGSLALTFFIYLFVNTGMVSGILPVVGVPLPLVSYGGTSMVTLMAAFGLLMGLRDKGRQYD
ncbi:MAG: Rod shape-determining protein RodA [uncultured Thiotrichaceae bacterium]|uniref:Peptidoglycan glycosyltransferase MrdB n=1 Tax=uncultured Thiotrichaceae bacterium TaxID=298394 RepID=A0A6S6SN25_9GAMM|nr:MAG: Rod shape-determining protein RodA [uncultured Thiotrichaceae bacterium]